MSQFLRAEMEKKIQKGAGLPISPLQDLKHRVQQILEEQEALKKRHQEMARARGAIQQERAANEIENNRLLSLSQELNAQLKAMEDERAIISKNIVELTSDIAILQQESHELRAERDSLAAELEKATIDHNQLMAERDVLMHQCQTLSTDCDELKNKVKVLEGCLPFSLTDKAGEKDDHDNFVIPPGSHLATDISTICKDSGHCAVSIGVKHNNSSLLNSLFDLHGSDKGSIDPRNKALNPFPWLPHAYGSTYESLLTPIKESARLVFECGIGSTNDQLQSNMSASGIPGASLRAWRDFFLNATVFGADIDKACLFEEERIKTFFVNQNDSISIARMWEDIGYSGFDLIIDDGLHTFEAATTLFESSYCQLRIGGIYIIEDICSGLIKRYIDYFSRGDYCARVILMQNLDRDCDFIDNCIAVVVRTR